MTSSFEDLAAALQSNGPEAAVERLCETLRDKKDYHGLFYALLLGKRLKLGLSAVSAGSAEKLPAELEEPYEQAIRDSARTAGQLYLEEGDIPNAWPFFRMINEPAKVADAIDKANLSSEEGERCQQIIDIALHQGANPQKGFDLVLKHYGICSAITMLSGEFPYAGDVRVHCIQKLVRELYDQLRERLIAEVERHDGTDVGQAQTAPGSRVRDLIADRDWLFEDEYYHIDVSHLASTVQMSIHLAPCAELDLAMELCEYGLRLSPRFRYQGTPPFENQYQDELIFLRTLAGIEVEEGIAHFRAKAETANPEETGTLPAEALVNLLLRLGRHREAIDAYTRFLADADARRLGCPSLQELCQLAGDYEPLVEVSRRRGDMVNFVAGLVERQKNNLLARCVTGN